MVRKGWFGMFGYLKSVQCCMVSRTCSQIKFNNSVIIRIISFLSQKNVFVKIIYTVSDRFSPTAGVAQGSVINPILFLTYVTRLPQGKTQI